MAHGDETDEPPRLLRGTLADGTEVLVTVWADGGGELAFRNPSLTGSWDAPFTLSEEASG